MPELPEVETIVRGLRPRIEGRRLREIEILHADLLPQGAETFRRRAEGRTFSSVGRRGKNIVSELAPPGTLWVNLGMTGTLLPDPPATGPRAPTHPGIRIFFDDGGVLVYDDMRRFGRLEVLELVEDRRRRRELGLEPLSDTFEPAKLEALLAGSRAPIRSWLLDQRKVAGVGNIYANEALHRARIHPQRPCRSLRPGEIGRLHRSIRRVLRAAINEGGTTIRDYRDASGTEGAFVSSLQVYGREKEPCVRCGTEIRRITFGGRSAFLCPRCQGEEPGAEEGAPPGEDPPGGTAP